MDFYEICSKSAEELFGKSGFASLLTSEITLVYYAFFAWSKKKSSNLTFTNYKENAAMAQSIGFMMIILIETIALHALVIQWSSIAAWVLTIASIYSALLILAHIKALILNPSLLTIEQLHLKNGLISRIQIDFENIKEVRPFSKELRSTEDIQVGHLGLHKESTHHNIAIYLKKAQDIQKVYGKKEECNVLLLHMDDKNTFIKTLESMANL